MHSILINLHVNNNQLKEIPKELEELKYLCELTIHENNLEYLPRFIYTGNNLNIYVTKSMIIYKLSGTNRICDKLSRDITDELQEINKHNIIPSLIKSARN